MAAKKAQPAAPPEEEKKRTRISQEDIPAFSLDEALRIATAIRENYGKDPVPPVRVASAISLTPTSSQFKMLCGSSIAYGLTLGGYNAPTIALTNLATRILRPTTEGDEILAKREAFLKPRVLREFLKRYDGSGLPRTDIAINILEEDFGVPAERAAAVLQNMISGAQALGLTHEIKGRTFIDLNRQADESPAKEGHVDDVVIRGLEQESDDNASLAEAVAKLTPGAALADSVIPAASHATGRTVDMRKIYVTHGKNRGFVEPIKEMLAFGELEPVVSVEKQSVSLPVPDKVMADMRSCSGAIIHVDGEMTGTDEVGNEVVVLNPNVLIEIGAAMALYGRRYILLVRSGVKLPSNLQGLYEVRYGGDELSSAETMILLKAIMELKKEPLPIW